MNRLILIGNGFDLAHGLKTSYNDFILWYIKKCYTEASELGRYKDSAIVIERNQEYSGELIDRDGVAEFIEESYTQGLFVSLGCVVPVKGNEFSKRFPFYTTPSAVMRALLENCSYTRWVDIEIEFYQLLKEILKSDVSYRVKEQNLNALNESLDVIIQELGQYLTQLPTPAINKKYLAIFEPRLKKFDVLLPRSEGPQWRSKSSYEIKRTCVLNFNYTTTAEQYIHPVNDNSPYNENRPFEIINIHGSLDDKLNPIVFGFGDELDDDYLGIERERARGYFKFIKSFWYFRTSNYWNLVRFIDNDEYQIYILGHSCGLSDRTMLHMIFEHANCKSIKIFYYGDEEKSNYTDLTYEIARHFKDKGEMRKRIIPFDRSFPMPQVSGKSG